MSTERPQWLDESFMAQVYASEQPAPISYEILNCGSVVGVGDNYLSKMFRITVKVTTAEGVSREDSLVVKSLEHTDPTMKEYGVFRIESEMYGSVLATLEGYWTEQGLDVKFGPRCLISVSQPIDVMVLSDLKLEGYAMEDRFERLGLEHAKLTLSKLAKFHAAGLLYKEREGAPPKVAQRKYVDKIFGSVLSELLPGNLASLEKKMLEIGMDQIYVDKIRKWQTSLLPTICRATDPDYYPADFHTLLHGDLWLNNEMFKYDGQGKVQDVKFVDYQLSFYGNPMFDFVYFAFTSIQPDIVVANLDALLAFYHGELAEAMYLLKAKTDAPSLEQLNVQLQRAGPFVATLLLDIIPIIIMDRVPIENETSLMTNPNADIMAKLTYHKMNNPRYEHVLKTYLPFWDQRGFLGSQLTMADLPEELKGLTDKKSEPSTPTVVPEAENAVPATPTVQSDDSAKPIPAPRSSDGGLPSWLTPEFIKGFRPTASEVNVKKCSSVVEIGDNYVAKMYRVDVDIKEEGSNEFKDDSYVIKSLENLDPMFKDFGIYETERELYVDVFPEFTKIWEQSGKRIEFAPKCLTSGEEPHDYIVLEDLNKSGFKMANRFEKLDLAHAKLTLSKMAKFHATSLVYKEKIGYGKQLSRVPFTEETAKQFHPLTLAKTVHMIAAIKKLGFEPEIVEKCEKWLETDAVEVFRLLSPTGVFDTIVHGDCWMNNIMYKYNDKNEVEDVLLIDFQITFVGNPIVDIIYFLFSSLRANILVQEFDELFAYYFDQLVEAGQTLGVGDQIPSFHNFTEQMHKTMHYAYMILPEIVPAVVMERHADANLAAFMGDPNSEAALNLAEKMFGNPKFIEILSHVIPFLYKRGFMAPYKPASSAEVVAEVTITSEVVEEKETIQAVPVQEVTPVLPVTVEEEKTIEVVQVTPVEDIIPVVSAVVEEQKKEEVIIAPIETVPVQEVTVEEEKQIEIAQVTPVEDIIPVVPAVVEEQKKEEVIVVAEELKEQPTSPTVTIEPWPGTGPDIKPKRLMKARIEETINKFAALENNGHSTMKPEGRASGVPEGYPKWLDKFYFTDLLRKEYSSFKIFKFSVDHANPKGQNYASLMYRVKLSIETNQAGLVNRNFMVKVNHTTGPVVEMLKLVDFFPKEIEMYTTFLPKFESMYRASGQEVRLGARCILGTRDPADLIILDDLCLEGFKSADRFNGLDMDHIHLTISKLAKMHSASVVYLEQGGQFDAKYDEGFYSPKMIPVFENMFQSNIDVMREASAGWSCAKTLDVYYDNWREILLKKMFPVSQRDDSRFNVLCHGDLWANNIMFKYSADGKPTDCLLVDLQICNYNSPMLDLQYFIFSSLHKDLRLTKIDYIISYYHKELVANLKQLGYKKTPPTLLQLQKDFLATGHFGLSTAIGTFSIAVAPSGDDSDINSMVSDSETGKNFKLRLYSNPIYKDGMEQLVPYFERKGYFEV